MRSFNKVLFLLFPLFLVLVSIILISAKCSKSDMADRKGTMQLPPVEADALAQLNNSQRHGEWVTYTAEGNDEVSAWVVYPETKDKAPVVIVIHEIYGLTDWTRAVTDQFAKEGFIAIAPDFLSGKTPGGKGSMDVNKDSARPLIQALDPDEIIRRLNGAAQYATSLPAAEKKYATVGFCWGGGISFMYATRQPQLTAAVVYYGTSPDTESLSSVQAKILGLYGGEDNRVNSTIEAAENELKRLNKSYEKMIFEGAGHAFLRQLDKMDGANLKAAEQAWSSTIAFFKKEFIKKL